MTGDTIFQSLMDLDLLLQNMDKMVALKLFLGSIDPSNPALAKLHAEILAFTNRIDRLVAAAQGSFRDSDGTKAHRPIPKRNAGTP